MYLIRPKQPIDIVAGSALLVSQFVTTDGQADNGQQIAIAINAAIDANAPLIWDAQPSPYVIASLVDIAIPAKKTLNIIGNMPTVLCGATTGYAMRFTGESFDTRQASDCDCGQQAISVDEASQIEAGDLVYFPSGMLQGSAWDYPGREIHRVSSVSGNTIATVSGLEFYRKQKLSQNWIASSDTGNQTFWYPSYYVASSAIEVLKNGTITTATYAPNGNANRNGWLVTVQCASGDEIEIRLKQANAVRVYKQSSLSISGVSFVRPDVGGGCHFLSVIGMKRPLFDNVELLDNQKRKLTDGITLAACVDPQITNVVDKGMRYSILYASGTRGGLIDGVSTDESRHSVSFSAFSADNEVRNLSGKSSHSIADTHQSIRTRQINTIENGCGLLNNRGEGGEIRNAFSANTTQIDWTHGIDWIDNGAANSPKATRPASQPPFIVDGLNAPTAQLSFATNADVVLHNVIVDRVSGANAMRQARPKSISVSGSKVGHCLLRFCGKVTITNCEIGYIDFYGASSDWHDVLIECAIITDASPIRRVQSAGRTIIFRNVEFRGGSLGQLFAESTGGTAIFENCIFDGFSGIGTVLVTTQFIAPIFVNDAGLQQEVSAASL
jgi:hypothetical protein